MYQKAFTVTQGGNDTAAETTIPTNIQPGVSFQAWEMAAIELNLPPDLVKGWASAGSDVTFQVTKRSLATSITRLVTYTDTDLIASWNLAAMYMGGGATPSAKVSYSLTPTSFIIQLPPGVILYSDQMYLQLISTGTGQTNIAWGRIFYDLLKLSAAQAMAVIASRP